MGEWFAPMPRPLVDRAGFAAFLLLESGTRSNERCCGYVSALFKLTVAGVELEDVPAPRGAYRLPFLLQSLVPLSGP